MLTLLFRRSTGDQLRQHVYVNVGKRLDVDATFPALVLAELCEKLLRILR